MSTTKASARDFILGLSDEERKNMAKTFRIALSEGKTHFTPHEIEEGIIVAAMSFEKRLRDGWVEKAKRGTNASLWLDTDPHFDPQASHTRAELITMAKSILVTASGKSKAELEEAIRLGVGLTTPAPATEPDPTDLATLTLANTRPFSFEGRREKCKVLKVYDGDTVTLGFFYHSTSQVEGSRRGVDSAVAASAAPIRINCRCRGYDTPELKSKDATERELAKQAKDYVSKLLLGAIVMVEFGPFDKYGRPLVDIVLPSAIPSDKRLLSEEMLRTPFGHAYDGGTKEKWTEDE